MAKNCSLRRRCRTLSHPPTLRCRSCRPCRTSWRRSRWRSGRRLSAWRPGRKGGGFIGKWGGKWGKWWENGGDWWGVHDGTTTGRMNIGWRNSEIHVGIPPAWCHSPTAACCPTLKPSPWDSIMGSTWRPQPCWHWNTGVEMGMDQNYAWEEKYINILCIAYIYMYMYIYIYALITYIIFIYIYITSSVKIRRSNLWSPERPCSHRDCQVPTPSCDSLKPPLVLSRGTSTCNQGAPKENLMPGTSPKYSIKILQTWSKSGKSLDGCLHFWGLHIGINWYARMPYTSNGNYNQESGDDEPLNLGYLVLQKKIKT